MSSLIASRAGLFGFRKASAICPRGKTSLLTETGGRFGPFNTSVEVAVSWQSALQTTW